MELRDYLEILRRRWLSACIVAALVLAGAAAVTFTMTPKYTATTRLFFAVQDTQSVTDLAQGSTFTQKQMTSYAQVATSPLVLDPVIKKLHLPTTAQDLAKSVSVVVPTDTVILEVSVTGTDPQQAAKIANAVGDKLTHITSDLSPQRANGDQAVKATVLAEALTPTSQSSPNVPRNLAVGLVLGLLLGVGVALLRNVLDTKIRGDHDIRALTDQPLLGTIAFDENLPQHPVVVADDPLSAPSEAIRRLRTNLQFVDVSGSAKTIVITSSISGEGKTTTSINLAVSLAAAGSTVLLIDADLRRPSVATCLGMEGRAGLTSVLIGRASVDDVTQQWRGTNLHVLPSGPVPPNPSELLGSTAMVNLLGDLGRYFDVILMDSPPLLPVTDATVLTKHSDGCLVVVGADRVHRGQLTESLRNLETAGATLFGVVLNKVARRDAPAYVYESGYYGSAEPSEPEPEPEPNVPRRAVEAESQAS